MSRFDLHPVPHLLPIQLGLAAVLLALLAYLPLGGRAILLLPITPGSSAALVRDTTKLLRPGPGKGSVVVIANGPNFEWRMLRWGVLSIASNPMMRGRVSEGAR